MNLERQIRLLSSPAYRQEVAERIHETLNEKDAIFPNSMIECIDFLLLNATKSKGSLAILYKGSSVAEIQPISETKRGKHFHRYSLCLGGRQFYITSKLKNGQNGAPMLITWKVDDGGLNIYYTSKGHIMQKSSVLRTGGIAYEVLPYGLYRHHGFVATRKTDDSGQYTMGGKKGYLGSTFGSQSIVVVASQGTDYCFNLSGELLQSSNGRSNWAAARKKLKAEKIHKKLTGFQKERFAQTTIDSLFRQWKESPDRFDITGRSIVVEYKRRMQVDSDGMVGFSHYHGWKEIDGFYINRGMAGRTVTMHVLGRNVVLYDGTQMPIAAFNQYCSVAYKKLKPPLDFGHEIKLRNVGVPPKSYAIVAGFTSYVFNRPDIENIAGNLEQYERRAILTHRNDYTDEIQFHILLKKPNGRFSIFEITPNSCQKTVAAYRREKTAKYK